MIRSTFIVGFPGETEEEFEELLEFLKQAQLDRVGCFMYSPVEGATANDLPAPVPEDIKQERHQRFMQVQSAISYERLQQRIGNEYFVIVDEVTSEGAVARSYAEAPEIDGVIHINDFFDVSPGDSLWVEIIHADEHDLWAVPSTSD